MAVNARTSRVLLVLGAFLSGLLVFFLVILMVTGRSPSPVGRAVAAVGGPFELVDQNDKPLTDRDMKGRPFLVFFGFTHCPDVCPTTLALLASVQKQAAIPGLRIALITVDPERDTPQQLGSYIASFRGDLIGLTGSPPEIVKAAQGFGVAFERVELAGGNYTMDHSAAVFMLDSQARIVAIFTPPLSAGADT